MLKVTKKSKTRVGETGDSDQGTWPGHMGLMGNLIKHCNIQSNLIWHSSCICISFFMTETPWSVTQTWAAACGLIRYPGLHSTHHTEVTQIGFSAWFFQDEFGHKYQIVLRLPSHLKLFDRKWINSRRDKSAWHVKENAQGRISCFFVTSVNIDRGIDDYIHWIGFWRRFCVITPHILMQEYWMVSTLMFHHCWLLSHIHTSLSAAALTKHQKLAIWPFFHLLGLKSCSLTSCLLTSRPHRDAARVIITFTWNHPDVTFLGTNVYRLKTDIYLFLGIAKKDKSNLSKRIQYFQYSIQFHPICSVLPTWLRSATHLDATVNL